MTVLLLFTATALSLWFHRSRKDDALIWMLVTYLGIGGMVMTDYVGAASLGDAVPQILLQFLLLGMVGFVQSLAVAGRISIKTAIVTLLAIFALVYVIRQWAYDGGVEAPLRQTVESPLETSELDNDGELLVELGSAADLVQFQRDIRTYGWNATLAFTPERKAETSLDEYVVLDVDDLAIAERLLATLDYVKYWEPNENVRVEPLLTEESTSAPAAAPDNLSINDPGSGQQWAMQVLEMDQYYRLLRQQRPSKKARIAILDTGIDARHEDLKDNYFSISTRYDDDPKAHGTHCAGIAAGVTNNGIGIASLAGDGSQPFVEITSIKVLNSAGMGTQKSIISGIIEAVDEGADVISLSLGGRSNSSRQKAYSAAVCYATDEGAIVVAAAGNSNMDAKGYSPANATGIITVSALDEYLLRAPFSNKVQNVQRGIAAPGVGIFSTTPNNSYQAFSGTSMACPFVAGLLGVLKSIEPDLDAARAYELIHATGDETRDGTVTGRVVQPYDALRALVD